MKYYKPIVYVTLGDSPNGIFKTQVVDVLELFRKNTKESVTLVSFVSIRGYFSTRKSIQNWSKDAWVFPMFPKLINWKINSFWLQPLLFLIGKKATLIGRGIFATNLLLKCKRSDDRVVYDGRGAIWAEAKEFDVYKNAVSNQDIYNLEKNVVLNCNKRIAVSSKLVEYWNTNYGYSSADHVIIPCSYNSSLERKIIPRSDFSWKDEDVVFVYSGSNDAWQGLSKIENILDQILSESSKNKILILAKDNSIFKELKIKHGLKIRQKWLKPELVKSHLDMADYGILIRPKNITNKVASPVKFAEYLASGLKVLISDGIGDFSAFVRENNVGAIVNNAEDLATLSLERNIEKEIIMNVAICQFSKTNSSIVNKYLSVLIMPL